MKLIKPFTLSLISLASSLAFINESNAATIAANSCSYADVSSSVAAALPGDTVTVPAGSCTWNSTLTITKGISLLGAGGGNTTIANGMTDNFPFLISYNPENKSANLLFRVSGFSFSLNPTSSGIRLSSGDTLFPQTKIRIDHNKFFYQSPGQSFTDNHYLVHAGVRGVVDNNDFGPSWYPMRTPNSPIISPNSIGGGVNEWNNWQGIVFGAMDNNLWFEDNTFSLSNTGNGYIMTDCQEGGRYAYRYNTIIATGTGGQLFDMHGNNPPYGWSCMGGEIYGNNIIGGGSQFIDQRGGRAFVFYNNSSTSWVLNPREEFDDSGNPVTNTNQYPEHVNGSYYWGNRLGYTQGLLDYYVTQTLNGIPAAGIDFFADKSVPGISCGTLASRPATCTSGQGFWATNQSCINLSGMVGDHPATPISGTLYRCTSANVWDAGASPLSYPHPLRGESKTVTVLKAPSNLRIVI